MPAKNLPIEIDRGLRTGFFRVGDPGSGGTISWSNKGMVICEVETAGAESRSLPSASGYAVGTRVMVTLKDDGGDLTITTGDTADVVLDTVGQAAEFVVTDADGTRQWRTVAIPVDQIAVSETATVIPDAQQEDIAAGNPGAISVSTYLTRIGADAGGDAFTLADGTVVGQLKKITMDDATGTGTVTLTSPADENTLTFDAVGETALLRWNGTGWRIVSAYNEADGADGPGLSTV